jgi:putative spermidine/putrescine transport system substrate-binding protein
MGLIRSCNKSPGPGGPHLFHFTRRDITPGIYSRLELILKLLMHTNRRRATTIASAAISIVAFVALSGCSVATEAPTPTASSGELTGELVFSVYPGSFQDNYVKAVAEPFMAENPGVTITYVNDASSAAVLAHLTAEKSNPTIDVAVMDLGVARTGYVQGMLANLDPTLVPNLGEIVPEAQIANLFPTVKGVENAGAAFTLDSVALMYNADKVSKAPTAWNDLWTRADANGTIAIFGAPHLESGVGLTVIATKMAGGDYKKSIDPGIALLSTLSPRVQTWAPVPDSYTAVANGSASYGVGFNARAQLLSQQTKGVIEAVLPKEGTTLQINTLNLVKGAPHPALAQAFINYALSAKAQESFSNLMPYAPTNSNAKLSAGVLATIPAADPNLKSRIIDLDYTIVAENVAKWNTQFQQQVMAAQ